MSREINTEYIVQKAREAGEEVGSKMFEVHGRYWEGRENLAKLIISLSSAILVGTITFSSELLSSNGVVAKCTTLLIISWALIFTALGLAVFSLWQSNTLYSFRARFFNSEPEIGQEVQQLSSELSQEELLSKILAIVKKYTDASVNPLGNADRNANYSLNTSLVIFGVGVLLFLVFGALQVT